MQHKGGNCVVVVVVVVDVNVCRTCSYVVVLHIFTQD